MVKGTVAGEQRGCVPAGDERFPERPHRRRGSPTSIALLAATPGQALTYTCVPPLSGDRVGIDRDEDGSLDRDELDAGSDPADPGSMP